MKRTYIEPFYANTGPDTVLSLKILSLEKVESATRAKKRQMYEFSFNAMNFEINTFANEFFNDEALSSFILKRKNEPDKLLIV